MTTPTQRHYFDDSDAPETPGPGVAAPHFLLMPAEIRVMIYKLALQFPSEQEGHFTLVYLRFHFLDD
jgi:hypothetical protein